MDDPKKIHGVERTPGKCVRRLAGDGAANNALDFFERQHHVKEIPVPAERKIDVLLDDVTASIEIVDLFDYTRVGSRTLDCAHRAAEQPNMMDRAENAPRLSPLGS
jgi:hypothetical protein